MNKPAKIGIITCSNATQEMDCCSVSCLRDFNMRLGSFQEYDPDQPIRLVGIINCAGCPTRAYPEKILRKVDSLARFGVTNIHFTNCMTAFCPFIKGYIKTVSQKYPDIDLVEGTHEKHITDEDFREKLHCAFAANKKMPDIILGEV